MRQLIKRSRKNNDELCEIYKKSIILDEKDKSINKLEIMEIFLKNMYKMKHKIIGYVS